MSLRGNTFRILMVLLVLMGLVGMPAAAGAQTVNGIKTPENGTTVGGIVDVAGYANIPNFQKWQLDLLPNSNAELAIWLAVGTTPGAFSYPLNTTPLPAGPYQLRLRIVRNNGNYDEYFSMVTVAPKPPAATTASASTITGIVWQWTSVTDQMTKKTDDVPNAQAYTITFNTDGTLNGKADCNNFGGTYSQDNGFSIKLGATTQAYCGDASLDTKYLSLLGQVAAGGPDGRGNLALETAGGAQRMLFKSGGAAPAAIPTPGAPASAAGKLTTAVQNANGIKSPADGATVGGIVVVTGYANSPDFRRWQIDLLPEGQADEAMFLVTDTGAGAFTYHLNTAAYPAGAYQLRLRIIRNDSNYDESFTKLTFAGQPAKPAIRPAAAVVTATHEIVAQNVNGIVTPKDGATINGVTVVTGYANSISFMKWQLDLVPSGIVGIVPIFLTVGTTPGAFTYSLPAGLFPPGLYQLRLRVVHQNSNYDEYFTKLRITR